MDDQYNLTQGHLYPSVTIVILVLFLTFIVTGCLSVLIRNCTNAHRRGGQHLLPLYTTGSHKLSHGLQSSEIDTLPTYIYSDVKDLNVGKGSLECAVCLGEFQNHESLRVLPKCDHVFHPSCIDPWLTLKSTCPVCRADLLALDKLTTTDFITTAYTSESTQSQSDERSTSLSIHNEPQPRNCECEKRIPTAEFQFPAGEGRDGDTELAQCEDTEKLEMAGTGIGGILNWKFKRSNSTGSSTVIGLDEELIYRDRFRLILSEDERRRIMVRSEHIRRGTTSAAALSLLPSDRSGYRNGADEGDWSDRQVSSLSRKCFEPITPATMEGRSGLSGRGDER